MVVNTDTHTIVSIDLSGVKTQDVATGYSISSEAPIKPGSGMLLKILH